jgi:putative ABC transport system permease protein
MLWQDVYYGARVLRQQPGFTATAVVTLALGMAAATTVFSVVDAELWRSLPFPNVDRLVAIYTTGPAKPSYDPVSAADFLDWQSQSQTFDGLAAYTDSSRRVLRGRDVPEFVRTKLVTSGFFSTLQLFPAIGRAFGPEDDAASAVIISDGCWRRLFSADPTVVGRSITLDDRQYTVVGILSPSARLQFTADPEMFVLLDAASAAREDRSSRRLYAIGRMKDDVTVASADAELRGLAARLAQAYPASHEGRGVTVEDLTTSAAGYNWRSLYFFLIAALFVLVLSCANVANLLLARALRRQREFAIRTALGGGFSAQLRQLLVEGLLLAVPGAIAGVLLSMWAIDVVSASIPPNYLVRGAHFQLDTRVIVFALTLCALTTVVFGLAPAMFIRGNPGATLGSLASTISGSNRLHRRVRHALVIGEVTTAFVLVFGAGLFLNSFVQLTGVPLGFEPENRFTMNIPLTGSRYDEPRAKRDFVDRLSDRVAGIPGVIATAVGTSAPLDSGPLGLFGIGGQPLPPAGSESRSIARAVTPGYFDALGVQFLAGRDFRAQDVDGSQRVVIINDTVAQRYFPRENPLGRQIVLLPGSRTAWLKPTTLEIIGVVSNIKDVGLNAVEFNDLFLPYAQYPVSPVQLVVRSSVPPDRLVDSVRRAVSSVDRDLPVLSVRTMSERVHDALRSDRFHLMLIGALAFVAMALAASGVFAAMAFAIEQRTSEFGVRIAFGATTLRIFAIVVKQSLALGTLGAAFGLALSLVLARIIGNALYLVPQKHEGLLYGVSTTDPFTLAVAAVLLTSVAVAAGIVPAQRAMRVDPIVALRNN